MLSEFKYPKYFISSILIGVFSISLKINANTRGIAEYGIVERIPNTSLLISLQDDSPPKTISASGLYRDIKEKIIAPGLIPYAVNAEFWSDGASKERFLALPGTAEIGFSQEGAWDFPDNTVVVKNFYLEFIRNDPSTRQLVETRFLVKNGATKSWEGFSYKWNEAGTDADLLVDSEILDFVVLDENLPDGFEIQQYFYPGPQDCKFCHTAPSGDVLAVNTAQLNRSYDYGTTGVDNQLRTLNHIGVFTNDIGEDFSKFPRWSNPRDEREPLERRVRSYWAANCSHCHRPGVIDKADLDLRFDVPLTATNTVGRIPFLGRLGADDPEIINPGDPDNSTLLLRLLDFSSTRMPPLATSIVDTQAVSLLRRWILQLDPVTAVEERIEEPPTETLLGHNYPNPFNASTTIDFQIKDEGEVYLDIYNNLGQKIRRLLDGQLPPGSYRVQWNGRTGKGERVTSGTYFYRLTSGDITQSRPLSIVK